MANPNRISLTLPDDWHIHLRDGALLATTAAHASRYLGRIIAMPNLLPPICDVAAAHRYRERILGFAKNTRLQPLIALYLTDQTSKQGIAEAAACDFIIGYKLYPAGATTNARAGVTQIEKLYPLFEAMQEKNLALLIHGETVDKDVDIFDREARFIDDYLQAIVQHFPQLKIVLEHITSGYAVDFIASAARNVAATITCHHLWLNRNDFIAGGLKPHHYCLPVAKTEHDRQQLLKAAISGQPCFFFGSDSAPHLESKKHSAEAPAGVYTGYASIECLAELFEQQQALDKLEAFTSHHGADFYGLARNTAKLTLVKKSWTLPSHFSVADNEKLIPFQANKTLRWQWLAT